MDSVMLASFVLQERNIVPSCDFMSSQSSVLAVLSGFSLT